MHSQCHFKYVACVIFVGIVYIFHWEMLSDIMCLKHITHNLGCGNIIPPLEINSLDEGSHPSAAGPHKSCLTRQRNEEFVLQIRVSPSLWSTEIKD